MADQNVQIETWNQWESAVEELTQLKKEMAERIVDKMREQNKDFMLLIWKDLVTDYLIDEWDNVKDFLLWLGINKFSEYSNQLNDLRERIKLVESKQELDDLEKSVIESLWLSSNNEPSDNEETNPPKKTTKKDKKSTSATWVTTWVAVSTSAKEKDNPDSWTMEAAPVWEAAEVPLKDRMNWIFPDWVPTKEKEMEKYLTTIKVPICTHEYKKKILSLRIHKKLSSEYKAIFKEMYDKKIPVNPNSTWWYNWRKMRNWKKMSHHSYGTAVDVNWDVNGWVYGSTLENSPYYNGQETVDIWKKHGFYWWWDWSSKSNDPMHFTYMNA